MHHTRFDLLDEFAAGEQHNPDQRDANKSPHVQRSSLLCLLVRLALAVVMLGCASALVGYALVPRQLGFIVALLRLDIAITQLVVVSSGSAVLSSGLALQYWTTLKCDFNAVRSADEASGQVSHMLTYEE